MDGSRTDFEVEFDRRVFPGTQAARILRLRFDRDKPEFSVDEPFAFIVRVRANETVGRMHANILIHSSDGVPVGMAFSEDRPGLGGGETSEFTVTLPNHNLAPGRYYSHVSIGEGHPSSGYTDYDSVLDTIPFEIVPATESRGTHGAWYREWGRIV